MVTQVGIVNSALVKIGADRISTINENTRSAILANTIYDHMRDQVLRDHPWNFAIKRVTIAPTASTPYFEYDFEYDKPNDCLRVLTAYPDDVEFIEEGDKLLSNESELKIRYVYRNEDESTWSSDFAEAFAWKLASELAYALTQSLALAENAQRMYQRHIALARSTDGATGTPPKLIADEWTKARL